MTSSENNIQDESVRSYRRIFRSTSIIGGASIANIIVALLRMKVAAVLLGPAGIGLIGLLQSLVTTAASVAALGVGTAGTRQIAEASNQQEAGRIHEASRALFWAALALAVVGGIMTWALRDVLATKLMNDSSLSHAVGWLGPAVFLTVAASSQGALLNGLRRIGDLARVSIASGILSTALGITALVVWGEKGIVGFVISVPLASFIAGHWYVAKLTSVGPRAIPLPILVAQWKALARLGTAFMVAGVVGSVGHLAVRTLIQRDLGEYALGQFQASWAIAMTYIGFVLGSMGADFYPRLVKAIDDRAAARRLVNEQTEIALLLAGPVLLLILALAPWVLELLYTKAFREAAIVLRWQVIADVLKVASWPLSYTILACGGSRTYFCTESLATVIFVLGVWLGLPLIGLRATGVALTCMYGFYLLIVYYLARRSIGFTWQTEVKKQLFMLATASMAIFGMSQVSDVLAVAVGLPLALAFGVLSIKRLATMTGSGMVSRLAAFGRACLVRAGL